MRIHAKPSKWSMAVLTTLSLAIATAAAAQNGNTVYTYPSTSKGPASTLRMSQTAGTPAPQATQPTAPLTAEELADLAADAYIYAYPMVLMEVTRRSHTGVNTVVEGKAPMNQFASRTTFPDANTPDAYWPSTDTVYSNIWYDVSRNPLIINIPDSGSRYRLLTFLDMWTDQFASIGTRTTGNGAQQVALVGPYWNGTLPANVHAIRSPTSMGWIIGRVQASSRGDLAEANKFQGSLSASPWVPQTPGASTFPNVTQPANPPAANTAMSSAEQVASMSASEFFTIFTQVATNNPPHANDYPILDRMRRIGIGGTYRPFNFNELDPAVQQALNEAAPEAGRRIADAVGRLSMPVNGWVTVLDGIGTYGTDYPRRAAIAYAGLGANVPEDVMYPVTMIDDQGELLEGDDDYVLHFDKAQLPPVHGFWSMMVYNPKHAFVANEANRYAIRSTDNLKYNSDGSLDIYIQRKDPGRGKTSNWLPTPPEGNFLINMRLYSPRNTALSGAWAPPPVARD